MKKNIGIIGVGQLGSRHLQGAKTAQLNLKIDVVDSSLESLEKAKQYYNEIPENNFSKEVHYLNSIQEMNDDLDLVIVATSAAVRLSVIKELITTKNVKNLILEKVLFQTEDEYFQAQKNFQEHNINAWVNCPRRMFPFYDEIKNLIAQDTVIFNVSGSDWGLACNSIHFIDCFSFITNQKEITINTNALDKTVYESKRKGYYEFTGTLLATTQRGDTLIINSSKNSQIAPLLTITTKNKTIVVDETKAFYSLSTDQEFKTKKVNLYYQSQLTGTLIEDVLLKKEVKLTPFNESMKLHLPFIKSLLDFYNKEILKNVNNKICPIT
jgi:dehydrogenase|nr:Gfo/Idh/MocA family oxidoreductase [uncultured Capnocytophaga sp.]